MIRIAIERLTVSTLIEAPGFGAAEVYAVEFDGYGYSVTYCTDDRAGWDALDSLYIEASGSVEFAGHGEPVLRAEKDIPADEVEAKAAALNERALAGVNAKLVGDILGSAFPALQAAE